MLFSILAVLSGATSYRQIQRFIAARRERLNVLGGLPWKRAPAHTSIRYALQGLKHADLEVAFRGHAVALEGEGPSGEGIAVDGKTLRGSCAHLADPAAAQLLSALASERRLILGHVFISDQADQGHDIPAAPQLIAELGLAGRGFTLDALHTQKNRRGSPGNW